MDRRSIPGRLAAGETWPAGVARPHATTGRSHRPAAKRAKVSELALHRAIAQLLDWVIKPPALWTTFPAGWGKMTPAMAGLLYSCGLKKGMPDILVFHQGRCFGIELKLFGRTQSQAQREMTALLKAADIPVFLAHSPEEVISALKCMKVPMRAGMTMDSQLLGSIL